LLSHPSGAWMGHPGSYPGCESTRLL